MPRLAQVAGSARQAVRDCAALAVATGM